MAVSFRIPNGQIYYEEHYHKLLKRSDKKIPHFFLDVSKD